MDNLQYPYMSQKDVSYVGIMGFKPYYKWITFNTIELSALYLAIGEGFKPYYKWITFNTLQV